MPSPFGATDSLICPKCRKHLMSLTRRTPHRVRGHDFETQTFTCRVCQHEIARDADRLGEVAS
jgi:RNase P subunit RPR2